MLLMAFSAGAKQLYICGDAPMGNGWNFNQEAQVPLTLEADGVTYTFKATLNAQKWFTITDGWGTSWDDFNANCRYGCADFKAESGTYQLVKSQEATLSLPAGDYEISINSETLAMTLRAALPVVGEDKYYVVGSSVELFGVTWNLEQTEPYMTKLSDNVYQWVKENVTLKGGVNIEWKVILNPTTNGWGTQYGANGKSGDAKNIVTSIESDGVYTLTFTIDLSAGDGTVPTVDVKKTGDAVVQTVYTVAGDERLTGANWNPAETRNDMVLNTETGLYEKTFASVELKAGERYGLKVVEDHAWGTKEYSDNGQDFIVSVEADGTYDVTITLDLATEKLNAIVSNTTAIAAVKQQAVQAQAYDLTGKPAAKGFKGLVVKNGKKILVK